MKSLIRPMPLFLQLLSLSSLVHHHPALQWLSRQELDTHCCQKIFRQVNLEARFQEVQFHWLFLHVQKYRIQAQCHPSCDHQNIYFLWSTRLLQLFPYMWLFVPQFPEGWASHCPTHLWPRPTVTQGSVLGQPEEEEDRLRQGLLLPE